MSTIRNGILHSWLAAGAGIAMLACQNNPTSGSGSAAALVQAPPATSPVQPGQGMPPKDTSGVDQMVPPIAVQMPADDTELPKASDQGEPRDNDFWWPTLLNLSALRRYESPNPLGPDFDYANAYAELDYEQVKKDMRALMTESKDWWPADYGHYGPFFIRMAWHSAGTYRMLDGRGGADGGQQRFEPLNSWPDNANLDKARRLIQPLVDKYYPRLSWADAMVLAGDLAIRDMGFETLGFAGGRTDDWIPDLVYWGPEDEFLKSNRFDENGNLLRPLAASVMGLIYVNPEGPDGKPDPLLSAKNIRATFGRMGMNDEETVALIAGGHTLGKTHGAHKPDDCLEPPPAANGPEAQLTGWHNRCGKGNAEDTVTSGIEGAWSPEPIKWTHEYLTNLYKYEWELTKGPGGKYQWYPKNIDPTDMAPDAHEPGKKVSIIMLTTDLALRYDPEYQKISSDYLSNPEKFGKAFARAWFKLIHRDLGPKSRYLGNEFPSEDFIWQDPLPAVDHPLVSNADVAGLKAQALSAGLPPSELIKTAWASAASYRGSDMKGGANGARIRLAPQKDWDVNEPDVLARNLQVLEGIQTRFNAANGRKRVSLADMIVIAGNAAIEKAIENAGYTITVPFTPRRTDASQEQTDVKAFEALKVSADGFRNYYDAKENYMPPARAFVDRADLLSLTVPEMTVLTGGLRVLGANHRGVPHGVFTQTPGTLTNDFFVNLMDNSLVWELSGNEGIFIGRDRETGDQKWTATTHDLIFGSVSELRFVAFTYASQFAKRRFIDDFVSAWTKVMMLDRFDVDSH